MSGVEFFPKRVRLAADSSSLGCGQERPTVASLANYLAQTYLEAGEKEKALAAYRERAALGLWDQEVFISLYRAAGIEADLGFDADAVIASYLQAHEARGDRAEALHGAARFCRLKERYQQGFDLAKRGLLVRRPDNAFFPEDWIYQYGLLDEYAINAYWTGRYDECLKSCRKILTQRHCRPPIASGSRRTPILPGGAERGIAYIGPARLEPRGIVSYHISLLARFCCDDGSRAARARSSSSPERN